MIPEAPKRKSDAELTRMVRNEIHRFLRALAGNDLDSALEMLQAPPLKDDLQKWWKDFLVDHQRLRTDPKARFPQFTTIDKSEPIWRVEQVLVDPLDRNDWHAVFNAHFSEDGNTLKLQLEKLAAI